MEKRKLGKYGAEVSPIGVGAMSFSNFYGPTNEKESHRILTEALDQDISHIDTANVYGAGASEAAIGSFLAKQGPQRNTLFSIATKVGIKGNIQTGKTEFDNSPDYLKKELDSSLKRLGVESVDLYYIHRRDQNIPY
jgi:aryl-alcohol dehydrogenase-like predicted oxidoreductase